ncbi:lactonase [Frigoribacterium sp. PhB24]|nr:lactonase [Frigoribacterium sp. PhB24]
MTGRRVVGGLAAFVSATVFLVGCTSTSKPGPGGTPDTQVTTATQLLMVTDVHPETGSTLLEGPTFGPDGDLYVVDVTAPAGEPKVIRIDVETQAVTPVYTDDISAFTSAQFSPYDGRLYLTDIAGGAITSITPEGEDPQVFHAGEVDGQRFSPDDLAFDEHGDLYVSDFTAFPGAPLEAASLGGRVVRFDAETAEPTVVLDGLASPNGISFTDDFRGLWLSQYAANRIDLLTLTEDGKGAASVHPAVYVDAGSAHVDSNAVDAEGNIYQGFEGSPRIVVHGADGDELAAIELPADDVAAGLSSATNVAIEPGTDKGYIMVSGAAGGYVYEFTALAEGIRQSNGG